MKNLRTGTAKFDTIRAKDANGLSIQDDGGNGLFIKDGGNVGIGTTNPGETLEVRTIAPAGTGEAERTAKYNCISILTEADGFTPYNGFGGGIVFNNQTYTNGEIYSSAGIYGGIGDHSILPNVGGHLAFHTSDTKTDDPTEKMRITAGGNVGIGETSPKADLHITSGGGVAGTGGRIAFSSNSGQHPMASIESKLVRNDGALSADEGALAFYTRKDAEEGLVEKIRIKHDGNVGIGTTNPAQKLDVNGNIAVQGTTVHTSDDRVKHNEQAIVGAIETLGKITPKKYIKTIDMYEANHNFELDAGGNPVDTNGEPVEHSIEAGVIAQQVLEVPELAFMVSPEGIDEDGNVTSPHGLNYNSLFTYAIAAIQEQQSIIEDLKSQNASLESRISALES